MPPVLQGDFLTGLGSVVLLSDPAHGADDQKLADVGLSHLADSAEPRFAAGRSPPRHEPQPSREVPSAREARRSGAKARTAPAVTGPTPDTVQRRRISRFSLVASLSRRSWLRSTESLPIASHARPGGRKPSVPLARGLQANRVRFASSWLHPLKSRSRRKTRRGSVNTAIGSSSAKAEADGVNFYRLREPRRMKLLEHDRAPSAARSGALTSRS